MTAAPDIAVRPLPTAFDPDDGPVTVATPSCCCCCCCCLAATTGAMAFTATDAYYRAKESGVSGGRRAIAIIVGLVAMPVGIAVTIWAAQSLDAGPAILLGMTAYSIVALVAFKVAGAPTGPAVAVAAIASVTIAMVFALELALALGTALMIELAFPLGIWLGIVISRSQYPRGAGGPEWPPPQNRPLFGPWEDPLRRPDDGSP